MSACLGPCINQRVTAPSRSSRRTSTPSTRRLLDGVAAPVHHQSTEPTRSHRRAPPHWLICAQVLVMRSMRHCSRDVGDLTERETHELILDVFVKSTLDVFSDPAQRKELGARIEGYASSIPFLPAPLLSHAIDKSVLCGNQSLTALRAESSRRPPCHRRDASSMAWRCRFLIAQQSQHGSVITRLTV